MHKTNRAMHVASFVASLALAACSPSHVEPDQSAGAAASSQAPASATSAVHQTGNAADGLKRFRDPAGDFLIDYPAQLGARREFDIRYTLNDAWKVEARAESRGKARLMLTLPGANEVTTAELRIGTSTAPEGLHRCTKMPFNARPETRSQVSVNGIRFTRWHGGGAAMSHYLDVRSYRTVHKDTCWAIDLLVTGTNPQVYAPPRTPPFSKKQAWATLRTALEGFRFTD